MPIPESLFPFVFLPMVAYFGYRFFKHGRISRRDVWPAVVKTFGDTELARHAGTITTLRVHLLADGRIVVEQSSRAMLAAAVSGIPMQPIDADRLIALLRQAKT